MRLYNTVSYTDTYASRAVEVLQIIFEAQVNGMVE